MLLYEKKPPIKGGFYLVVSTNSFLMNIYLKTKSYQAAIMLLCIISTIPLKICA